MRKLSEPEAHRARVEIMEGRFPPDMKTRCAWCSKVGLVSEGEFVARTVRGLGPTQFFMCSDCRDEASAA